MNIKISGDEIVDALTTGSYPNRLNHAGEDLAELLSSRVIEIIKKRLTEFVVSRENGLNQ